MWLKLRNLSKLSSNPKSDWVAITLQKVGEESYKMKKKQIFTVGTSTRTFREFLECLKAYQIESLVDVRSFPTSRLGHFKQENLRKLLEEAGISYIYLGKELGGYRKGGYEAYTQTSDFKEGIRRLENVVRKGKFAFFCAERFPWRCHRRFIALELKKKGWEVVHIIEKDKVWIPKT